MKLIMRWYGKDDPIPLNYIKQIPVISGVVSAIYDIKVGEIWPLEKILKLKEEIEKSNLEFEVIESVPVHEDIKLRRGNYVKFIENYKQNIINLAKAGIKCICYNFMPVFDWTRSTLNYLHEDGSISLAYFKDEIEKVDVKELSLPGWDESYNKEEITTLIKTYQELGIEGLWKNLELFLKEIIPVAKEHGVKMAIHPDDPPWDIFGIPRIIKNEQDLDRFLKLYDDIHNGLTLCSGSLGCSTSNDYVRMVKKYGEQGRIHFAHLRNVKILDDGSFIESAHYSPCGSLDMVKILKAYYEVGFNGYIRPDHGRMIWGEQGKPGYGLYDRALGAMYLGGIIETLEKIKGNK